MTTVIGTLTEPNGDPASGIVSFQLYGDAGPLDSAVTSTGETIVGTSRATLDATGGYSVALTGNADIVPTGTVWARSYSGGRVIDTLSVPATGGPYDETDIRADAPGSIDPTGLATHAADTSLHAGGLISQSVLTADFTIATSTYTETGMSVSFTHPGRPYYLEWQSTLWVVDVGAVVSLALYTAIGAGTAVNMGAVGFYAANANTLETRYAKFPVPYTSATSANSPDWHKPTEGDLVTYDLRLRRASGTGNVSVTVDSAFFGKNPAFLRAVYC